MCPPAGNRTPLSVLIIDDYADAATSLAELLRIMGHRAAVARSGPEALAAAEREPPDVILLELRLPGLDGWAVARRLRDGGCRARLMALTTCACPEDGRRLEEAGVERYFLKPAVPAELLAALVDGRAG